MQVKVAANPPAAAFNLTSAAATPSSTTPTAPASSSPASTRSSSGRPPTTPPTARASSSSGNCTDPDGTNKCDGLRPHQPAGRRPVPVRQPQELESAAQDPAPAQGAPRRDELGHLRRVRPDDGQPRPRGRPGHAGRPEHHALPVRRTRRPRSSTAPTCPRTISTSRPISDGSDGTQIWKITHNGVDTHPIHFHLYDVQVLNRVTWDNIIIPPEPIELGWKDTVRVSPLEDTIVALRPIMPDPAVRGPEQHPAARTR